jgi:hypothetical protein
MIGRESSSGVITNYWLFALFLTAHIQKALLVEETSCLNEGKPTIRILNQFFGRLHSPQLKKKSDFNLPNFI